MWPLIGSLIGGASSLLGGMFTNQQSAQNVQAQNQEQIQMNQQQEQFQESMSNTAYQRASQDMKAAGLNPMMMFGSGSAASTPSGGQPQIQRPQYTSPLSTVGDSAEKFVNSAVTQKTIDKLTEEISNLQAGRMLTEAQTGTEFNRQALVYQQGQTEAARSAIERFAIPPAAVTARTAGALQAMPDWLFNTGVYSDWGAGKAGDWTGVIGNLLRGMPKKSTSNTVHTDPYGDSSTTFSERWDNMMR